MATGENLVPEETAEILSVTTPTSTAPNPAKRRLSERWMSPFLKSKTSAVDSIANSWQSNTSWMPNIAPAGMQQKAGNEHMPPNVDQHRLGLFHGAEDANDWGRRIMPPSNTPRLEM
mmetsp:Transcript_26698/g.76431  ORF Transcript_26698/g.76431 Transcript_26698/m.76431 type:complete len:117 (-) Transcript_26698:237-587(-)